MSERIVRAERIIQLDRRWSSRNFFLQWEWLLVIIVVNIVNSSLSPYYLNLSTFLSTPASFLDKAFLVLPMTMVIILGNIDISVGSTVALSAVVFGLLLHRTSFGRRIYGMGNNLTACRYSGVKIDSVILAVSVLTGLGLPSEMATYIENGVCPYMFLWNPIDVGYLGEYTATALVSGKFTGAVGDKFSAGRLGDYNVTKAPDGGTEILLGSPFKFDKANIGEWKTVS